MANEKLQKLANNMRRMILEVQERYGDEVSYEFAAAQVAASMLADCKEDIYWKAPEEVVERMNMVSVALHDIAGINHFSGTHREDAKQRLQQDIKLAQPVN